jgi:hypothetical protein
MYASGDPRLSLKTAAKIEITAEAFSAAEYARLYETAPQIDDESGKTWLVRGQNFVIAYTVAKPGATFARKDQADEYVAFLYDREGGATIDWNGETTEVPGYSAVVIPGGDSSITLPNGGVMVRMITSRAADLCALCSNQTDYAQPHPNIPPFQEWPTPPGGWKVRHYSLDVASSPDRFGRLFRCTTFMFNFLPNPDGPKDITKLTPHYHNDFEQCSFVLRGEYMHHLRWPWTPNLRIWREDNHEQIGGPSVTIIPPLVTHTSHPIGPGLNVMLDIFCPPRVDFSERPGWVLNADEYPMPEAG